MAFEALAVAFDQDAGWRRYAVGKVRGHRLIA